MAAYYNDIDAYCCKVLRKNIQQGHLPEGTVDGRDIKRLTAADFVGCQHVHLFCGIGGFPLGLKWAGFPESIRVLTGGFPCQDISNAGQRAGITGERSGLWKEMCRLIQEAIDCGMAFDYIIVENVAALVNRGLSVVLGDLAEAGYDAEWVCLRAADVGAPHQRERVFIVAHTNVLREAGQESTITNGQRSAIKPASVCRWEDPANLAHTNGTRSQATWTEQQTTPSLECSQAVDKSQRHSIMEHTSRAGWQEQHIATVTSDTRHIARRFDATGIKGTTQPLLGRVLNGISRGMDRYRWPAGPAVQQHEWEPARVVTGKASNRIARLKALGNAIVPQLIAEIGRSILEEREVA